MWKNCSAPETITKGVEKLYGRKDFFIYTGYPPPISYSPSFTFDLQRFVTEVSTFETLKNALENGGEIKLTNDISNVTETLNISKETTLDLNGRTLTFANTVNEGFKVSTGKTFTVDDTSSDKNGLIVHTAYTSTDSAKNNRKTKRAVYLNDNANFTMKAGNITSNSASIYVLKNNSVNITGGSITSNKSDVVYFFNSSDGAAYNSTLTVENAILTSNGYLPTIQTTGNVTDSTKGYTINLNNGANIVYNESDTVKNDTEAKSADLSKGAIFISGASTLNVNDGANITSSHVGIEFRAGTLNVNGGTIESTTEITDETAISYHKTARGVAFNDGVAIAVAKAAGKNIEVNINDGTIEGYAALAVANPNGVNQTAEISVKGGTLTSTSEATADEATYLPAESSGVTDNDTYQNGGLGKPVPLYKLKGKNAIVNFDEAVTIDLSGTKVIGSVAAITKDRTGENTTGYNIGTGNTFSNFNYEDGETFATYYTIGTDTNFQPAVLGSNKGWAKGRISTDLAAWTYRIDTGTSNDATLAPASGSSTTKLELKTAGSANATIPLDLTDTLFSDFSNYTELDASAATSTYALNIKGNNNMTKITGGKGTDTLTAVNTTGVTLNGGTGEDSLVGGEGKDTFIHQSGSDTIDNYDIANDTVTVTNDLPTDLTKVNYNTSSSKFVVSLGGGEGDSLTFNSAEQIKLTHKENSTDKVYYYKADRVIKNDTEANNAEATLGAEFKEKTFNVNKLSSDYVDYSKVTTINAQAVQTAVNITGNSENANSIIGAAGGGNIVGGDKDDVLKANGGSTTLNGGEGDDILIGTDKTGDKNNYEEFVFTGGEDVIKNYDVGDDKTKGDLVVVRNLKMADASYKVTQEADNNSKTDIVLDFGSDTLTIEDVGEKNVSVRGGYTYNKNYFAHNKGITLAAGYNITDSNNKVAFNGSADSLSSSYVTINAAAVTSNISIVGNDNSNYIVGSTVTPADGAAAITVTLNGGDGNDRFDVSERYVDSENTKSTKYVFEHDSGKDEVFGFKDNDTLGIAVESITAAKAGNSKLTFTIDKNNSIALRGDDDITKVNLQDTAKANYLTKDGYVKTTTSVDPATTTGTLTLFESAKGRIELGDETYKDSNINAVDAKSVEKQSVTLVGGTQGGTFTYATGGNKKRDGFVYGGGKVTIEGYEDGKDRIDLNGASITSFTVTKDTDGKTIKDVVLTVGDGSNSGEITLTGAAGKEVLLRNGSSRSFKKMVFAETGVLQNKSKNPTMVTISGAATGYSAATDGKTSVKKIYVEGITTEDGIQISAGNKNNTIIDASAATQAVTLEGGKKNDKLIGSADKVDTFVYTEGKDIIQNFVDTETAKDQISLSSAQFGKLGEAKITAGSKSIKFKFANKDTLTIKATKGSSLSGSLDIASEDNTSDITRTYTKNAIAKDGAVTLTSAFSGTFKTDDKKLAAATEVDGTRVSKNLTFKGTEANETFSGGKKKNTFKGGGGADTFIGGSGKDIFFYAKGDKGETTIADFEFGANKDRLKIASGTIGEISTLDGGKTIQFAMNSGKKGDTSNIGWFKITSGATYDSSGTKQENTGTIDASKVAIKANNTYYWFATDDIKDTESGDVLAQKGQLITSDTRVSAGDVSGFSSIIDLNYSTNLAKSGVAIKVAGVKPKNG